MESEVLFREWKFLVDSERTREVHQRREKGGTEMCGCNGCLNFAAQRDGMYPHELRNLLLELGIDYCKEADASHMARHVDGTHVYNGCFHFKGRISEGRDCKVPIGSDGYTVDGIQLDDHINVGFLKENVLNFFDKEEYHDLVQIDFSIVLPWVLNDVEEYS